MFNFIFSFVFITNLFLPVYDVPVYDSPDIVIITHLQGSDGTWLTINDIRFNGCYLTLYSDNGTKVYENGNEDCGYERYYEYTNDYPNKNYRAEIMRKEGYIYYKNVHLFIYVWYHQYLPIITTE